MKKRSLTRRNLLLLTGVFSLVVAVASCGAADENGDLLDDGASVAVAASIPLCDPGIDLIYITEPNGECGSCTIQQGGDVTFTTVRDLAGNGVLHYNSWGGLYYYANGFCQIVKGCDWSSANTTIQDGEYSCRCDSYWGCDGYSCANASGAWSRFSEVSCAGCPTIYGQNWAQFVACRNDIPGTKTMIAPYYSCEPCP